MEIPTTNPASPAKALKSPPAKRRYARQGQPRKTKAPIMAKKPRPKRTIGDEPPRGRYSLNKSAEAKEPKIKPASSGRKYCTTAARCSPKAPATSRVKQATQTPILPGLPNFTKRAASTPIINPATAGPFLDISKRFIIDLLKILNARTRENIDVQHA